MLFIEYDVGVNGVIDIVALVNAVEEHGEDPLGEEWLSWRRSFDDHAMGCAAVSPEDLSLMESTDDPAMLANIVERIILTDRRSKEEADARVPLVRSSIALPETSAMSKRSSTATSEEA